MHGQPGIENEEEVGGCRLDQNCGLSVAKTLRCRIPKQIIYPLSEIGRAGENQILPNVVSVHPLSVLCESSSPALCEFLLSVLCVSLHESPPLALYGSLSSVLCKSSLSRVCRQHCESPSLAL